MHHFKPTRFAAVLFALCLPQISPDAAVARPAPPVEHAANPDVSQVPAFIRNLSGVISQTAILFYYLQGYPDCLATNFPTLEDEPGCLYFQALLLCDQPSPQPASRSEKTGEARVRNKVWFGGAPLQTPRKRNRVHHRSFQGKMPPVIMKKKSEEK